jgi:hypothetical protein
MLDRFEPVLKWLSVVLAVVLVLQVAHCIARSNPLANASVPPLPKLSPEKPDKNSSTNSPAKRNGAGTNAAAIVAAGPSGPNANAHTRPPRHWRMGGPMAGFMGGMMGGPPMAVKLPGPVQARVDRIKESEILGPVPHPMPMALLGIADDDAFLRAPDGQTGMVKEGGELGGIKLLRIGTNRVLVEQDGEKKELTLFSGFGGDSMLPQESGAPTDATVTPDNKENP